jgi:hypothetical protein
MVIKIVIRNVRACLLVFKIFDEIDVCLKHQKCTARALLVGNKKSRKKSNERLEVIPVKDLHPC